MVSASMLGFGVEGFNNPVCYQLMHRAQFALNGNAGIGQVVNIGTQQFDGGIESGRTDCAAMGFRQFQTRASKVVCSRDLRVFRP